ncbi:UNVERIFIED_CONTAM: hypothetical protein PYX00_008947 [Menopon gallinae]|uniref:Polycomb protein Sfmbt n=1 Tax=Menopon gallinae TaxID=328185 RepID=A0AAW2H9B1_9NEOP
MYYGMMWMSPSHMLLPQTQGDAQQIPSEMLQMDAATTHLENPYYPLAIPPSYEALGDQSLRIDNFMMMDDFEAEYCDEPPKFSSAATQTSTNTTRKIKPIKHPGLKLQTPIAYKCDTDPSVIPIQKDGMAICEKCGAIGVKHSFYTRHRNYCSLACARGSLFTDMKEDSNVDANENAHELDDTNFKFPNGVGVDEDELISNEALPMSLGPPKLENIPTNPTQTTVSKFPFPKLELPVDDPVPPVQSKKTKQELASSYNWDSQLAEPGFIAVPVSCFKHAPMADCWDNITVGMKVEVENRDCEDYSEAFPDSFWVATVLRIAGYKALLRYEGFGQNNDKDFWVNLCCNNVHPVGWCATRGKPLIPPKTIEEKYKDWKDFLVKRLTGARTLPSNFYTKVHDSLKSRFRVGMNVEVVDKNRISQVCVATVKRIVGKRLHVEYYNGENDDNGFWCHEDSPLLHPVGWASRVGHLIDAPEDYIERCESGVIEKDDATDELFTAPQQANVASSRGSNVMGKFQEGMKLEAIDPLNLSSICVATVMKVLRDGYLMIRIDSYPPDVTGSDWFCYHSSSPHIFPPGFCHKNSVPLIPPKDYDKSEFRWDTYVKETSAVLAPVSLFEKPIPSHGFVVGMRLEAADLMDPRLVCVGTVSRVVGRLLKIHFDGWEEEYDQWLDCESPDVYPVGWCNLVSHKLEGPRCVPVPKPSAPCPTKKRQKRRVRTKQKAAVPNKKPYSHAEDEGNHSVSGSVNMEVKQESDLSQDDGSCFSVAMNSGLPDGRVTGTKEPETGREPSGPDQSLPVSASPQTHNSVAESSLSCNTKYIPRLIDSSASTNSVETGVLNPSEWNVGDVEKFLKMNDCSAYSENFRKQGIDGKSLLQLTKDHIMDVIGFKIGPTLKIYDLIQQLKVKANKANFKKII